MKNKKSKKEIKAQHLKVIPYFLADYFEDESWIIRAVDNELKQGNPKEKYYVLLETEMKCAGWFMSKKKLTKLITENSGVNAEFNWTYTTWDKITVLDIDEYKIVKPYKMEWK